MTPGGTSIGTVQLYDTVDGTAVTLSATGAHASMVTLPATTVYSVNNMATFRVDVHGNAAPGTPIEINATHNSYTVTGYLVVHD